MRKGLISLERIIALASVFILPSQLALHFWPSYALIFGIRVDYLAPAIYLSDVLIVALLALIIINAPKTFLDFLRKNQTLLVLVLLLSLVNVCFSTSFPISLLKWIKVFEITFFGFYIFIRKSFLGERTLIKTIFLSALLFSLIGIVQSFSGGTTGFFYFLGERSFRISTPGIATAFIGGKEILRAYSTFPHPNVFAGYLGLALVLLFFQKPIFSKKLFYFGLLVISFALFLTFSLSTFLALGTLMFLFLLNKANTFRRITLVIFVSAVLFSLSLPIFSEKLKSLHFSSDISQRLDLSGLSGVVIGEKFLQGTGLNTFILESTRHGTFLKYPWLLQPVHNIFLLVFTEAGIFGVLLLSFLFYKFIKISLTQKNNLLTACLLFILITGISDHYWLTLQQGLLSAAFFLGFSSD